MITREQIEAMRSSLKKMAGDWCCDPDNTEFINGRIDCVITLALEALDKREVKTTVRKVWRNYENEKVGHESYSQHSSEHEARNRATANTHFIYERIAVPTTITITETEGH